MQPCSRQARCTLILSVRHKYETRGIVLSRSPLGEMNTFITLLTPEIGLVRARAQGLRRSGAKLAAALATLSESDVVLVRGREGWRLAGAVKRENWFQRIPDAAARSRAARVSGLFLRLVAGEAQDPALFPILNGFFRALAELPEEMHEAVEILAALRVLSALGFDAGEIPGDISAFTPSLLAAIAAERTAYITRINHGIEVSGL